MKKIEDKYEYEITCTFKCQFLSLLYSTIYIYCDFIHSMISTKIQNE